MFSTQGLSNHTADLQTHLQSSADLLCSTASWNRRKRAKGSDWRNTSVGSLAGKTRMNPVFSLSKQGGLDLRKVQERGWGETTTRRAPESQERTDVQRMGANTTLEVQKRMSSSAKILKNLLASRGFYLPECLLREEASSTAAPSP